MTYQLHSISSHCSRPITALLISIVITFQSGCATLPEKPELLNTQYQSTLGKVAIVSSSQLPEIQFQGFANNKAEGAAAGAGKTFNSCMKGMFQGSHGNPIVAVVGLVVCGVATPVGGVVGAIAAPSSDEVKGANDNISKAFEAKAVQDALRDQVVAASLAWGKGFIPISPENAQSAIQQRDYRVLGAGGVDTVLEVALTNINVQGEGFVNPPLLFSLFAHIRLIRTNDNSEIFSTNFAYVGEKKTMSEWTANRAAPLLHSLQAAFQALGMHIYEYTFLFYPTNDSDGPFKTAVGLAPIYPRSLGYLSDDVFFLPSHWTTVDSMRPTLRWEAFPRALDIKTSPDEMGRVKNVRYDLIIARERNLTPSEVVYRRDGLMDTFHTVEISLNPATRYFWNVRARFELDGRERVIGWSSCTDWSPWHWAPPFGWTSFRFKTPK